MKKESVICEHCKNQFEKSSKEVARSLKLGRKQFCSRSCSGKNPSNISHLKKVANTDTSKLNPGNRRDQFTGFREHLRRARSRDKEIDVELSDLKEIFDNQKGICVYSGVLLVHPIDRICDPIYTSSMDRIDSNKGYVKDNIQFISIAMNNMKNSMTHEKMLEALSVIKQNNK